jgi:hypothetical protein
MMRRQRGIIAAWATAALGVPTASRAQDKPDDKQQCLAAAEQGQNQRDDGHYRAAHESFSACARAVCPRVVLQSCTRWLRELDQDAPTVVLGAKDDEGNDLTNVRVSFDGALFATVLDGKPIGADAGEHVLRFERDGSVPVEQKLVLRAGEKARVVTVTLRSESAPMETAAPEPVKPPIVAVEPQPPEALLSAHHVAAAALAVGALGAAGAGALFLVGSNQAKDDAARLRSGLAPNACTHAEATPTCQSLGDRVNSQHRDFTIAMALFAGGGVFAAGAVVTWLVWPQSQTSRPRTSAWIAPAMGGATLQVGASFR